MPKAHQATIKGRKPLAAKVKFKLGGRKSTVSALNLSTEELLERLARGGKDVGKIVQVLDMRKVSRPAGSV